MTWPELEVQLSDQEYFDAWDELADEPDPSVVGSLHRAAGGARTPQPTPSLTPSETPTSSGRSEGGERAARRWPVTPEPAGRAFSKVMVPGQPLPRSLSGRLTADCHAGHAAVARTPSGQLVCHWCRWGSEDVESPGSVRQRPGA